MASTPANSQPRTPQQARAAIRRVKFLDVTALLIGQHGSDALTMTSIAVHAGAYIGYWKQVLEGPLSLQRRALVELFIEQAYLRTGSARLPATVWRPVVFQLAIAARGPIRRTFADALRKLNFRMSAGQALICAHVIVELIKGRLSLLKHIDSKVQGSILLKFEKVMRLYLTEVMQAGPCVKPKSRADCKRS